MQQLTQFMLQLCVANWHSSTSSEMHAIRQAVCAPLASVHLWPQRVAPLYSRIELVIQTVVLEQGVYVSDGEEHIARGEQPHARNDITLPEDDKWLQRILHTIHI